MDDNKFGSLNGFDSVNNPNEEQAKPENPVCPVPPPQSHVMPGHTQPPVANSYTVYTAPPVAPAEPVFQAAPAVNFAMPEKKPDRVKKQRRMGSMVAAMLATALITSAATGAAVYALMDGQTPLSFTAENPATEVKTINVESTADNIIEAVAEKASPSVVGILVNIPNRGGLFGGQGGGASSQGSGVIYSADGYIITNYHVIASAVTYSGANIEVYLPSAASEAIPAKLIGYDSPTDLAVLKIEKTGLPAIEMGDSSTLKVGETVVAIGNPGGLEFMGSVSAGIISGLDRKIVLEDIGEMRLLQTDAAINPGNSGGALVNAQGKLVGINNSKMAIEDFDGMAFSIPVNTIKETIKDIIENKDLPTPVVGITISDRYNEQNLTMMGYPAGIVVASVSEGGPAAKAGIEKGDIITKINDTETKSLAAFNSTKNKFKVGETITVTVYRSGQYLNLKVTLGS